jgi:hypothetical protein
MMTFIPATPWWRATDILRWRRDEQNFQKPYSHINVEANGFSLVTGV